MNKYFLQNDLNSKLIDKFNFDSSASESLIEKIKNIENFSFEVDGIEIQENNEDCDVKINIEKAFSEDEIKEYKLLKDKFAKRLKEFSFIGNIYKNQKKCAQENFNLPLAIKIKLLIDEINLKIDCEKKAILGINQMIFEKEKAFASKINDFKSVLATMKDENKIDIKKLNMLFGEDFINSYKENLILQLIVDFLNKNKNYTLDSLIESSNYIRNIVSKYSSLEEEVVNGLGTDS